MSNRPQVTVSDAIATFEVERRTLQRLLSQNKLVGATKDPRGHWLIPIEALHAAGFAVRKTWISDATDSTTSNDQEATSDATQSRQPFKTKEERDDSDATNLRQRVASLEAQLESERLLREAVERNANDLRSALRMIEAGSPSQSVSKKRRWWSFRE